MYLSAYIITKTSENLVKIPRRAIFSKNKIFIVNNENKLEIKDINIISNQKNHILTNTLNDNTLVVIEPLINTKEGSIVKPIMK